MLEKNPDPVELYASLVSNSRLLSVHSGRIASGEVEIVIVALPALDSPMGELPDPTLVQRVAELDKQAIQLLSADVSSIKSRIVMEHSNVPRGYSVIAINPLYNFG